LQTHCYSENLVASGIEPTLLVKISSRLIPKRPFTLRLSCQERVAILTGICAMSATFRASFSLSSAHSSHILQEQQTSISANKYIRYFGQEQWCQTCLQCAYLHVIFQANNWCRGEYDTNTRQYTRVISLTRNTLEFCVCMYI
jgi:hypothetical protein